MSGKIFISYRREDSSGVTGRIYDRLESHFGSDRIFMDVDAIEPGMDFVKAIESAIGTTDVFLAVIGPTWLTATDAAGNRRLENPEDFVRSEVAAALARDLRIIPVLVSGAMMPRSTDLPDDLKSLTHRNAIELSHTRFNMDAERLIHTLEQVFEQFEAEPTAAEVERIAREKARAERLAQQKEQLAERVATWGADAGHTVTVWLSVLWTTIGWGIGGAVGGAVGGAIGGIIGSGTLNGVGWGIGMTFATIFSGAVVGFVLGIALRHTQRRDWWKQVFLAFIGASIGAIFGVAIGIAFGGIDKFDVWIPWAFGGPLVGLIGSGVTYWVRNRSRHNV